MTTGEHGYSKHVTGNRVTRDDCKSDDEYCNFEERKTQLELHQATIDQMNDFVQHAANKESASSYKTGRDIASFGVDALANARVRQSMQSELTASDENDTAE